MSGLELRELAAERGGFRLGPVTLEVAAGTATVLLGPSGAGKTTLLRAVAGFLPLAGGTVWFDGEEVGSQAPERRRFGFVPPNLGLLPHRRVEQNVRYPLDLRGDPEASQKARGWMERFELVELGRRFPFELSSGQRQRVAMARALAAEPRLLLWDEPLAALDVESRDGLIRLLRGLIESEQLPLLLVTHDPSTAGALASRWVVLEHGRVRFDAPPEALSRGPLDRFTARFLGYENLYSPTELAHAGNGSLAPLLRAAAGPGGIVVPSNSLRWRAGAGGPHAARVEATRRISSGWVLALRQGGLTFHAAPYRVVPSVRVGDTVSIDLDLDALKPLEASPVSEAG
ncbi:MAG: ATP-binding cassette domain-containing protein [Thermoplasmata archaeon]|nr:ATP-binding cassette domain-containing protein [Thermoplasmata archaeon]